MRELQRSQECVLSRLEESVRRREEAWSSQHTHAVTQLQKELQVTHTHTHTHTHPQVLLYLKDLILSQSCLPAELNQQTKTFSVDCPSARLVHEVMTETHIITLTLSSREDGRVHSSC